MIEAARNALELWGMELVPSLFPFMIITNLFSVFFNRYFSINNQYLIIFLGNICGYPIGAKLTANYYKENRLTLSDANYVLTLCNQSSIGFLEYYVGVYALNKELPRAVLFILFYLSTFITAIFTRKIYPAGKPADTYAHTTKKHPSPEKINWFQTLDLSITDSCKTMLSIGGYVLIFSVLIHLFQRIFAPVSHRIYLLLSLLEITNGLSILKNHFADQPFYSYFVLLLTGFGGFCTMAQIKGMLVGTSLSVKPYILGKTIYTIILLILYLLFKIFSFSF